MFSEHIFDTTALHFILSPFFQANEMSTEGEIHLRVTPSNENLLAKKN